MRPTGFRWWCFGTWFVNNGNDFRPQDAIPVGTGWLCQEGGAYPALRRRAPRRISPTRPLSPFSGLVLLTCSSLIRRSRHGVRCDAVNGKRRRRRDGSTAMPMARIRAGEVGASIACSARSQIPVAQRFGDAAMLIHDRRHPIWDRRVPIRRSSASAGHAVTSRNRTE